MVVGETGGLRSGLPRHTAARQLPQTLDAGSSLHLQPVVPQRASAVTLTRRTLVPNIYTIVTDNVSCFI